MLLVSESRTHTSLLARLMVMTSLLLLTELRRTLTLERLVVDQR